jgi:predicted nucleotidyltransferase
MGQNNQTKILEVFYENPNKSFTIREIAKLAKVPRATAHKAVVELKKEKLLDDDNRASNDLLFKTKKTNHFIEKLITSGLIEELVDKLNPSCIILFGSIRKGESDKKSDIDLFAESFGKKEINLSKYEKELGHEIQLFVYSNISKVNENLRSNIVNGIKLYGYLNIK